MSHITHVSVSGLVGCKKHFEKALDRHVNVFFGKNGCGKTSLLKLIHSAMKGDVGVIKRVTFESAEIGIYSQLFEKEYRYRLKKEVQQKSNKTELPQMVEFEPISLENLQEFVHLRDRRLRHSGWKITPTPPNEFSGGWHHRFLPTSRLINPKAWGASAAADEDFYDASFARELERVWNEFFGSVQAQVRQIQQQGIASILGAVISSSLPTEPEIEIDSLVAYEKATTFVKRQGLHFNLPSKSQFQDKFNQDPLLRRLVSRIIDLESKIEKAMERRTKLQALVERMFSGRKRLELGDTTVRIVAENNSPLELLMLSSGEKHLLRILFEAVSAGVSTLIIDEPEISLHIEWQRELVQSIREVNPELQLIIATHSPEVMAEVSDSNIIEIKS